MTDLHNILEKHFVIPTQDALQFDKNSSHRPKILLLYGSLRERSFSRLVVEESAKLLEMFGCETKIYTPCGLPPPDPDDGDENHPKTGY